MGGGEGGGGVEAREEEMAERRMLSTMAEGFLRLCRAGFSYRSGIVVASLPGFALYTSPKSPEPLGFLASDVDSSSSACEIIHYNWCVRQLLPAAPVPVLVFPPAIQCLPGEL